MAWVSFNHARTSVNIGVQYNTPRSFVGSCFDLMSGRLPGVLLRFIGRTSRVCTAIYIRRWRPVRYSSSKLKQPPPAQTKRSHRLVYMVKKVNLMNSATFVLFGKYCPIVDQLGSKDSSRDFQLNCIINYFFYLHLILYANG